MSEQRLIDANALLERVDEERKYLLERGLTGAEHILVHNFRDLIDNAPTIEAFTKDEYEGAYLRGYVDSAKANERPQGEWKEVDGYDGDVFYECSQCSEPWVLNAGTPEENNMNFCPNCGADMKGDDNGKS